MKENTETDEISADLKDLLEQQVIESRRRAMVDAVMEEDPNAKPDDVRREIEDVESTDNKNDTT